jgi:hypothetical protein
MPVTAYVARDPAGNPWPPVHEHEAAAAIGLIQRLHESLNHERPLYLVLANLQAPSADLVVLTELGLGVVELKHYGGALSVQAGDWYAGSQLVKAGVGYPNPREQVQAYATRIRRDLLPHIAGWWSLREDDLNTKLKVQTAVCFTNQDLSIAPEVKDAIERDARQNGRRWSTFQLLTPASFAAWVSGLRFEIEKDKSAQYAPQRLSAKQIEALALAYFKCSEWSEIRNLMPSGMPYAYLTLRQEGREPQLFPLRAIELTLGRDTQQTTLQIPQTFSRSSRVHARLWREASEVWVADANSSHGTYVNGRKVTSRIKLRPGQRITLGGPEADDRVCELHFTVDLPPEFQANATGLDSSTS